MYKTYFIFRYKEENHRSVSKDDLQLQKFDDGSYNGYQGYHPRSPTAGRVYDSGLPDSRIIRGREHKVLKDDRGSGVSHGNQGYHPRSPTAGRVYDSGLPDSRIIRGREHKVLKDDRGSEVSHGNQGYHPRSPTAGRVYDSGLPDSRIIRGREHMVLKDYRGSEVKPTPHHRYWNHLIFPNFKKSFPDMLFHRGDFLNTKRS